MRTRFPSRRTVPSRRLATPKGSTNLTQVPLVAGAILHHRGSTDYFERRDFCQIGENVILNAGGEIAASGVSAQVFKWQYGDASCRNRGGRAARNQFLALHGGSRWLSAPVRPGEKPSDRHDNCSRAKQANGNDPPLRWFESSWLAFPVSRNRRRCWNGWPIVSEQPFHSFDQRAKMILKWWAHRVRPRTGLT